MSQDAVGDPWTPAAGRRGGGRRDLGQRLRAHAHRLPRRRRSPRSPTAGAGSSSTLQGLVRTATLGPLQRDEHIGDVLRHVEVLKLNDEEAKIARRKRRAGEAARARRARGGPHARLAGVAWVVTARPDRARARRPVDGDVDPTGAGDTYSSRTSCSAPPAPSQSRPRAPQPRRSPPSSRAPT